MVAEKLFFTAICAHLIGKVFFVFIVPTIELAGTLLAATVVAHIIPFTVYDFRYGIMVCALLSGESKRHR